MKNQYRGFSTLNRTKKFRVTDVDLIKQNLYNHFNTRKGEKLMQPGFGSIIWNMMFEPLTEETKNIIVQDVKSVVSYDPRTRVSNVVVTQFEYGIQLEIELVYIVDDQTEIVKFTFDNNSQKLTQS